MLKPIKRHKAIQPLSRAHHQDLLLCWKIRTGFKSGIEPERIKKYVVWFYNTYIIDHFEVEEKHIFPILGEQHVLIQKALAQHRRLRRLIQDEKNLTISLNRFEEELESHIRFEERILFNEIQEVASQEQLQMLEKFLIDTDFVENTEDVFWKK